MLRDVVVKDSLLGKQRGGCQMRTSQVLATAKIFVFILILSASPGLAQEKVKFPVGASSKTLGYGPLWVAWKQGFFDQQGLDAQVVLLRGTPPTVQALVAGSVYWRCYPGCGYGGYRARA